jgi:hypothetical protein
MHVFRCDQQQSDPDPTVRERLLTHLRDVGRRRTDKGTVYPLIEIQTAAHAPGGYIHPILHTTRVYTFGLSKADSRQLAEDIQETMKHSPRFPTERSHPILGAVYAGEQRATAEVVRFESLEANRIDLPDSVLVRQPGTTNTIPLAPLLDKFPWQKAVKIVGHVLYDPKGLLTGWGHRLQMDGNTIAFHFPSTQRCFRLTSRVEHIVSTSFVLPMSATHNKAKGVKLRVERLAEPVTETTLVVGERRLSCGCNGDKRRAWMFTRKCTCGVAPNTFRSICYACVARAKNSTFYADTKCIRTCNSLISPKGGPVYMRVSAETRELLLSLIRADPSQVVSFYVRHDIYLAVRLGATLAILTQFENFHVDAFMTTFVPFLLRSWQTPLQKISIIHGVRIRG